MDFFVLCRPKAFRSSNGTAKCVKSNVETKMASRFFPIFSFQFLSISLNQFPLVQCHIMSESHQRQMILFSENSSGFVDNFSGNFEAEFVKLLKRRLLFLSSLVFTQPTVEWVSLFFPFLGLARGECLQIWCTRSSLVIATICT